MKTEKLKVLIIEDSEDDFSILLRELNKGIYEIEYSLVMDAAELRNALLNEWDVIISDYSLPGFTGKDALVMCMEKGVDIPFIMVSGTVGEDIAVEMMRLGARDYIMKNSLARLLPAIDRELEDAISRKKRKEAEEALKVSEKIYHSLFDQANEGLILFNIDGKFSDVNQAFVEMHGYTVDEIKKMELKELEVKKASVHDRNPEIWQWVNAGEVVRLEIEHYHKDRHIIPLSITISRVDIGNQFYLVFYQDITERKKAEAAVQKKIADLEWFNSVSVGRELKMVELKMEINELLKKLGEPNRYEIYK
jgi:PAS domain S-box-containing protein